MSSVTLSIHTIKWDDVCSLASTDETESTMFQFVLLKYQEAQTLILVDVGCIRQLYIVVPNLCFEFAFLFLAFSMQFLIAIHIVVYVKIAPTASYFSNNTFCVVSATVGKWRDVQRTLRSLLQRHMGNSLWWWIQLHWRQSVLLSTRLWVS